VRGCPPRGGRRSVPSGVTIGGRAFHSVFLVPDIDLTITAHDGVPLAATLTLPDGPGPFPAALLLFGSGPLDRDGNTPKAPLNLGAPLARVLAWRGIATLRFDRRGVGKTPGIWRATGFTENRLDAATALAALSARPDVREVAVIGHSEGTVHAMAVAEHADAVVLLAAYARPGEEALRWQANSLTKHLPVPRAVLRTVGTAALGRVKKTDTDQARIAGIPVNARWVREMLAHDPRPDLARIKAPVLAVTGSSDIQVDPADLEVIRELVPGRVETHNFPGLTHVLRVDQGKPSIRSYPKLLRQPVDAGLLNLVADWLSFELHAKPQ
jgi:pimeloyl-ACP methyl ester carboxylesterase